MIMVKDRAIRMSKDILSDLNIEVTKENTEKILSVLKNYSVLKTDKMADYECEGQIELEDYLESLEENELEM